MLIIETALPDLLTAFRAIENFLFYDNKTRMLFGNAKDSIQKLVSEIKNL